MAFHRRVLGLTMIVGVLLGACSGVGPTSTEAPDSETPAVSAGARDHTSATVTWTAPATDEPITGYELRWRSGTDTAWETETGIAGTATSYTITGLQPRTTYQIQVRAVFATTVGAWSESVPVSTTAPPDTPPTSDQPGLSEPTAGSDSITVTWTAPATDETIKGYELQWRSSTDTEWTPVTGIARSQTSYTITGLQPQTTYQVQVRALFATTAGPWSQSITVSTTAKSASPASPPASARPGLSLTELGSTSITVEWVAPATDEPITSYELHVEGGHVWSVTGAISKTYTGIPSTATGGTIDGLQPMRTYQVRVRAMFGDVAGPWFASLTCTTVAGVPLVGFTCVCLGTPPPEGAACCRYTISEDAAATAPFAPSPLPAAWFFTDETFPATIRYEVSETGDMLESQYEGESETDPPGFIPPGPYYHYSLDFSVDDDDVDEPDSTITVQILPDPRYQIGAKPPSTVTITITDDDDPPSLAVDDVTVTEGDSGTVNAAFTVSLSTASGWTVTVDWATSDGTATAGSDYTAGSGSLTFAAGDTSKTFDVAVTGDEADEADETYTVTLTNAEHASIEDATATGTITDDD